MTHDNIINWIKDGCPSISALKLVSVVGHNVKYNGKDEIRLHPIPSWESGTSEMVDIIRIMMQSRFLL
jgi:hypothetical protein